jgi:hypothetical protein
MIALLWRLETGPLRKVRAKQMNMKSLPGEGDQQFVCIQCDKEFVFTAEVQKQLADKGLKYTPKRCKSCVARKNNRFRVSAPWSIKRG